MLKQTSQCGKIEVANLPEQIVHHGWDWQQTVWQDSAAVDEESTTPLIAAAIFIKHLTGKICFHARTENYKVLDAKRISGAKGWFN